MRIGIWNARFTWRSISTLVVSVLLLTPALVFSQDSGHARTVSSHKLAVVEVSGVNRPTVVRDKKVESPSNRQVLARVDGQPVYADELSASAQGQLMSLRNQEYDIKRKALDNLVDQKLLEAAAKKKGLTPDQLIEQEVGSKITEPTDAELEAFYFGVKDRLNRTFAEVKTQLTDSLRQAKIYQGRQAYLKQLRETLSVSVLLSPPRVEVAHDPARVRGNPKPQVMIVEFSDYQCPYCHSAEPTLRSVLAKYGDKVGLSYRDFPLSQIHANAEIAAEASRCAGEQGKFWEYHDQLFTASKLDREALSGFARDLKLDDQRFESCLTSEKYKAEIEKDVQEGRKAGVSGTPAFFINGAVTTGAQQETLMHMIDEELNRSR